MYVQCICHFENQRLYKRHQPETIRHKVEVETPEIFLELTFVANAELK